MASKTVPPQAEATHDQERGWWDESPSPAGYTTSHPPPHASDYHQQRQYYYATDDTSNNNNVGFWDKVARTIVAILLPPLGVFFQTGCNKDLAINVLLTLFGYIPGIIHALYVICVAY